jgi:hypothetical protein
MNNTNTTNAKVSRANVGRKVVNVANKGFGFYEDTSTSVGAYSLLVTIGVSLESLIEGANWFSKNPTKENFDQLRVRAVVFSKSVQQEKLGKFGR